MVFPTEGLEEVLGLVSFEIFMLYSENSAAVLSCCVTSCLLCAEFGKSSLKLTSSSQFTGVSFSTFATVSPIDISKAKPI